MGTLFYIAGASGAGKDTLISYCRNQINGTLPVIFAHRYITRPANAGGENHVHLSEDEFKLRLRNNLFAMHWVSHGLYYGVGIEIDLWLSLGLNVVINGSREYLPTALEKYPSLRPILIEATAETIKERLLKRGRENSESIAERIGRSAQINTNSTLFTSIHNDGLLEDAGNELLTTLLQTESIL